MNLHDYIKPFDKQSLENFAASCGTTVGQLKQVATATGVRVLLSPSALSANPLAR